MSMTKAEQRRLLRAEAERDDLRLRLEQAMVSVRILVQEKTALRVALYHIGEAYAEVDNLVTLENK